MVTGNTTIQAREGYDSFHLLEQHQQAQQRQQLWDDAHALQIALQQDSSKGLEQRYYLIERLYRQQVKSLGQSDLMLRDIDNQPVVGLPAQWVAHLVLPEWYASTSAFTPATRHLTERMMGHPVCMAVAQRKLMTRQAIRLINQALLIWNSETRGTTTRDQERLSRLEWQLSHSPFAAAFHLTELKKN